jgi:long-chain acyl-CoA synthetase
MNVARNLERSALFFPQRPATREGEKTLTYGELNQRANRVATGLIASGIQPGDVVGLCTPNSGDWISVYFGALKAGAVALTLFSNVTTEELNRLLLHAKPRILYTTESRASELSHLSGPGQIERVICASNGAMDLQALMSSGSDTFRAIERDPQDTAVILYTGGTTGVPKGVMLPHESIVFASHGVAYCERSNEHDSALSFLPFNHVFGQVHVMNATILTAGCLELLPGFDMDRVLDLLQSGRVTKFFSVPTVYVRLLRIPDLKERMGRMRFCLSSGASMPVEIVRQWKEATGITIAECYGMSEGTTIAFNHLYPERHVVGSVGQPINGVEVQIRDESGKILAQGEEGEICIRGRNTMKGYLNNPEGTKDAFWDGGWLRSGDIGRMDERDYVYIVDRLKDLIITGGENVYPREVEEALYCHPDVGECAVIGLPDREWGERIAAYIIPKSGKGIDADELKHFLKTRLAPFKVPKEYVMVSNLPKSPGGKILKRDIKKERVAQKG